MPTHILHMPEAGRQMIQEGISPQSKIILDFPVEGVVVGREGDSLVFSHVNGARLVISNYFAPQAPQEDTEQQDATQPTFVVAGREMPAAVFFSTLGEEGMPEQALVRSHHRVLREEGNGELMDGITRLDGLELREERPLGTLMGLTAEGTREEEGISGFLTSGRGILVNEGRTAGGGTGANGGGGSTGGSGGTGGTGGGNTGGNQAPSVRAGTASILEDAATVSGTLPTPTDPNAGDVPSYVAQTNVAGNYGTLSLNAAGNYTYTLNNSLPVVQGLSVGDTLTDTFTFTVSDGHGGTATNTLTLTINGSNDAPTITVSSVAMGEDSSSVSGTLPLPVDPDVHDTVTFTPQAGTVGLYGTFTVDASGKYTYVLNTSLPAVQGLGAGATLSDTFTFSVSDGHGGTATSTLTMTINGSNDAPVALGATVMIMEDSASLSGTLPVAIDSDAGDSPVFIQQSNISGLYGTLSLDVNGNYIYVLNNALPAVQALSVGDSLRDVFTFTVSDGHGGTASNSLTLTINGTNDAPTVAAATAATSPGSTTVSGTLPLPVDPDAHDTVTFIPQNATASAYGTFSVDAAGHYVYILNESAPAVLGLGAGESLTDTFTYTVSDGHGGTATNTLSVTINGTNDAPTVTSATASIGEDSLTVNGTLPAPVDPDVHDVVTFVPQMGTVGNFGNLSLNADGSYVYTLNTALPAVQGLGAGGTLTDTFTFTVSDGHGGTATSTLTLTINGSNDSPTVAAATGRINEDTPTVSGTLPHPTDPDSSDTVVFVSQTGTVGSYGTLTVNADGSYVYSLNNALPAVQGLNTGDTLTEVFTYTVSDGHGGTATNSLTITITGSDDTQGVGFATASIFEDTPSITSVLPIPPDVDIHDTVTFTPQTNTAGIYGSLSLDAAGNYTYTLNNTLPAVQGLGVGETYTELFTYAYTDSSGASATGTLTVTIIGTNDVPVVSLASTAIFEDSATASGTLPVPLDADVHDSVTFIPQTNTVGNYGSLSVDVDGTYVYTLNNALPAVQGLGTNETLTDTFTFTVSDGQGGTGTSSLTVTINGSNDAPVVAAATGSITEDTVTLNGILPVPVDPDSHDTVTFIPQTGTVGLYGTLTVDASGNYSYSLNNGLPAVQGLGGGETLTDTFTFTVSDGHGGTTTSTLTLTINGTNDAPLVAAATGSIAEDTATLTGNLPLPSDADARDTVSFIPQAGTAGLYGTLSVDASGKYTYSLNNTLPEVQALSVGDTLHDPFIFTVSDGHGGTTTTTLTLTIHGTNDLPVVAAATGSMGEDTTTLSGNLPAPTDVDAHDLLSFVPQAGTAGVYGSLTVNADGSYTYSLNTALPVVQGLGAGETLRETFTFTVSDGRGGTANNTLTLTINGTNDAPVVVAATGTIAEDATAVSGNLPVPTDADVHDTVTFIPQAGTAGLYGTLTVDASGNYTYSLNNTLPAVQALSVGDKLTDTFTFTVSDGHGGTATNTLTLTINGTNDFPVVAASTGAIAEDTAMVSGMLPVPTDVDAHDVLSFVPQAGTAGLYGSLTVNADGSYTYSLNSALPVVQALSVGDKLTETFTFAVSDGQGGTATNTLVLTINGTNDAPLVAASTGAIAEDTATVSGMLPVPTDVDAHDSLTFIAQAGTAGLYGSLKVNADGSYTYTLNNALPAVQALSVGDKLTDTFTVTVSDGQGGTATNTLILTINGTNDAPVVAVATGTIAEDTATVSGTIPLPTDVDAHDSVSFVPQAGTVGLYGTLKVNADGSYTYSLNNALPVVQSLSVGDKLTDTFTFVVSDGQGGTASNTLILTINGTNDAPMVGATTATITKTDSTYSGQLVTPTDIDAHDVLNFIPQINAAGTYGKLNLNADGSYTYSLNTSLPAVLALLLGQQLTDTFNYTVSDGHGGTATNTLTLTISGNNGIFSVGAAVTIIAEDSITVGGLLPSPTGTGLLDVVSFIPQTASVGLYGSLKVNVDGSYIYTLNNALSVVQALSVGDTLTETFSFSVSNGHGGTATNSLTLTINGTNDLPVVGAAVGSIAENTASLAGNLPLPTDVDAHDVLSFVPQAGSVGLYGSLKVNVDGSYIYTLNNALPIVQALGVGDKLTETFSFTVSDGHGGTATNSLTLTINGTNDLPVVAAAVGTIAEDTATLAGTLPLPTDVDVHDILSFVPQAGSVGLYGSLKVNADGTYIYTLNNALPAVQALSVGDKLTDTFTFTVSDNHGGSATNTLILTINGSNDLPVVAAAVGSITEDTATLTGTLPLPTDVDAHDFVSFVPQVGTTGLYGSLKVNADGSYTYTLNNALPSVQALSVGDKLTETFSFTVSDGHGGTATNTLILTINGSNDLPVVTAAVGTIAEDTATLAGNLPLPTDVDAHDVLNFIPQAGSVGLYGTLKVNADGSYSYTLNNALPAVQALSVGDKLTDTFSFSVSDGYGGTATNTLILTINGSNDLPVVAAAVGSITEDTATLTGNLPLPTDVDAHDVLTFVPQAATVGLYGSLKVHADGSYTYSLNNALPVVQGLGVGETLTDTFSFNVSDGHGGTATNTLILTINGSNDLPIVAAAVGTIAEDTATLAGNLPLPTDVDTHDVLTFVPQAGSVGLYGTLKVNADGSYSYTLNNALPAVQALSVGDTLTDTFSFSVSDGHGATATNTLTLTINGTNDLPLVAAATANLGENTATLSGTLPVPTDVDAHDVVSFIPQAGTAGLYGTLKVNADGSYTYSLNNTLPVVKGLGAGETLTDTFSFNVSDGHGGTATNTLVLTINGSNDLPVVAAAVGTIAEDTTTLTGNLPLPTDVDTHDLLTFIPQVGTAGLYGSLTVNADGSYTYTLNNALPAVQALSMGDKLTDTFTFSVSDGHGGTVTNTLTLTIDGSNDLPVVAAAVGTIAEDTVTLAGTLPLPTDVDAHDVLSFVPHVGTAGLYGSLTVNVDGSYTYSLNNALPAVQALSVGDKLTDTFTFSVSDGHGGTATSTLTLIINGTNDLPVVAAATGSIAEDAVTLNGSLPVPTDVDTHDMLSFVPQAGTAGLYGSLTVIADGSYTYTLNNALPVVQALSVGDKLTDTFSFTVSDGHGGTVSNTLTLTINGTNDLPQVTVATGAIIEDTATLTGNLPVPTDVDVHDVLTFVPQAGTAGLYGSLKVHADGSYTYTLNNALPAVQALGVGDKLTDTFTFTVSDGHGGTATSTLTLTINGSNDAPVVVAATGSIAEDTAAVSGNLPVPADVDAHDVLSFIPQVGTVGLYGSLKVNADGSYTYTLNNALPVVQALSVGDTLTDTFTFSVSDGRGGTGTNILTLTINGTNDAPIVVAATGSIAEDATTVSGTLPVPTDVDAHDVLSFTPQASTVGLYGSLKVNTDGSYTYTLNNALPAVQALSVGDKLTDTFTFTVSDGQGGTATSTLTLTINGTNDAPVVAVATSAIAEDTATLSGNLPAPADVDAHDLLTFIPQAGTVGLYGSLKVNADGSYTYTLNNTLPVVQALSVGDKLTDTFTFAVSDGHGGTASNTLTLTINGTNDAPMVGATTATITKADATYSGHLVSPTDIDAHDVLNFITLTNKSGTYGKLNLNADGSYTYNLNTSLPAVLALLLGQQLTDTFSYTVTDGHGGTATNTLTLTITGNNGIFSVGAAISIIAEDSITVGGLLPSPTGTNPLDVISFIPQVASVGLYGSLKVNVDGSYIYTLNNALSVVQALSVGDKLTETFSFTVSNGHGGTATNSLTLTINGTNDLPVVGAAVGSIAEDTATLAGNLPLPTDVDVHDVLSFVPQLGSVGLYGTLKVNVDGSYTYTLNNALPIVQALGVGETLIENFAFTVSDGHGGIAINTLTLTINGTNDLPVVAAAVGIIAEDTATLTGTLPLPADVDVHDILSFAPQAGTAGLYGSLKVNVDGSYTYTLNNALPIVQALGVGDKLTESFNFTVSDGHGGTVTNTLTLTINGTNDLPIVGAAVGSIAEGTVTLAGTLPLPTDVDVHDVLTFVPQAATVGLYGSLKVNVDGSYTYTLNNALPMVQALSVGDKLTDTFSFIVSDGHGGTATNTLTLSINGTNDLPIVGVAVGSIAEGALTLAGTLPLPTDVDAHDVLTFIPQVGTAGLYGSLKVNVDGSYTYTLNNALPMVQALSVGDKLTETFNFTVSDGHGGTVTNTLTLTINGTNDIPVVAAATGAIAEGVATLAGTLPLPTDVDAHDVLTFVPQAGTAGLYGSLKVNVDGSYTYSLNNALPAVQALSVGDKLTDTFTFTVSDGLGGTATNTLTLTINGTNDLPVVAAATAAIAEGIATLAGTLPLPTDVDTHDVLSFIPQVATAGLYGSLKVNVDGSYTYTLNNALPAVQALSVGDKLTDTFSFSVSDGHGGTATNTLTLTIDGTNDAPRVAAAIGSIFEDAATVSGRLPVPTDVDMHDTVTFTPLNNVSGLYGTLKVNADGTYVYTLNNALPAVQGLGVGEKLTDSFTFSVSDGHGGTAANILRLTINGTNDAPSVGASTGTLTKSDATLAGRLVTPTDPDNELDHIASDTLSFIPKVSAGLYGTLTLKADGSYVYALNTGLLSVIGLLLNQKLTDTFTYTVSDGEGGTASNTLTLTIKGGLGSLISLSAVTNTLVEGVSTVVGTVTAPLNAVGNVVYSLVGSDTGQCGQLTLLPNGSYSYHLDASLAVFVGLGAGESIIETFTFSAVDALGKTATSTISLVVKGENQAPEVLPVSLSVLEHDSSIVSGLLHITDLDVHDLPHVNPYSTEGSYGTFIVNANGSYTYVVNQQSTAVLGLGVGESVTESFPVIVQDGHGGTANTLVNITINGQNDAPTVAASSVSLDVSAVLAGPDGTHGMAGTLPTPHDADIHDVLSYVPQGATQGLYGDLSLKADGSYVYVLHTDQADVKNLDSLHSLQDVFNYVVSDGHGGTATNTLTLTIHGVEATPAAAPMAMSFSAATSVHTDATVQPTMSQTLDQAVADNLWSSGDVKTSTFDLNAVLTAEVTITQDPLQQETNTTQAASSPESSTTVVTQQAVPDSTALAEQLAVLQQLAEQGH